MKNGHHNQHTRGSTAEPSTNKHKRTHWTTTASFSNQLYPYFLFTPSLSIFIGTECVKRLKIWSILSVILQWSLDLEVLKQWTYAISYLIKQVYSPLSLFHSSPNLVTRAENPDELLYGPIISNETSYEKVHLSRDTPGREAKTMAGWTGEL